MSLVATPYVKHHKLTKVANKYCSHYDKASENCGPLRLEENARKHTANQRKTTFLHLNCYTCCHASYSFNTASNDVHSFCSLQRFLAKKCKMPSRR